MPIFRKFVEVGRVAYIISGPDAGKLVVICNVIDQNRALVDGPCSGVGRKEMHFHSLHLTSMKLTIPWRGRSHTVRKAWETAKIDEKWANSNWAKRVEARRKRANMSDFDRFKLAKAVHARNKIRQTAFRRMQNKQKKNRAAKLAKLAAKLAAAKQAKDEKAAEEQKAKAAAEKKKKPIAKKKPAAKDAAAKKGKDAGAKKGKEGEAKKGKEAKGKEAEAKKGKDAGGAKKKEAAPAKAKPAKK